jgi:enoyl-CoA hydratase
MAHDNLIVDREGAVAIVTVNRPAVLNALNTATIGDLDAVVTDLAADEGVRAVVLTGAGEKAFVAGADIRELATLGPVAARAYALAGQRVFTRIEEMGKPVIAAVNGFALGGGCELAMACTLRLASETARFGQPEVKLGLIPGFGGTQRLPRLVGKGRALQLLLTGELIDAQEAWRIGLVNRVVAPGALQAEARALAAALAAGAPIALRYAIDAVNQGLGTTLAVATEDMREGTAAFVEKRTAVFTGRS